MEAERKKILEMIEEGKITAQEGMQLLEAINDTDMSLNKNSERSISHMKIRIYNQEGEILTKINIPFYIVEIGLKIGKNFTKDFGINNFDIEKISELIETGNKGKIFELEQEDGTKIEIILE